MDEMIDVAVVGGGPAGLNGALMLARSRRSVVVIDAGQPRNAPASGVHGFLTRDGIPPAELRRIAREEVASYGARLVDGTVVEAARTANGFELALGSGERLAARRLLVTTGLVDELPEIPGVRELWGGDVLHCPYCHGWEVRDQAIGVLATSHMATHQALLFRQLSDDVVVFAHTQPPTEEQAAELTARGVRIVEGEVAELERVDGRLTGVRLVDGASIPRQAAVVAPRFVARSAVLESLGVEVVDEPGVGSRIVADDAGLTNVPGVWVAGNVTDLSAQVVVSAAGGSWAAARINADLVAEDVRAAVEAAGEHVEHD